MCRWQKGICILFLAQGLLSGCMSMMVGGPDAARDINNWAKGKSDVVVADFERDGGFTSFPVTDENYMRLGTICNAYFELRDHDDYDRCVTMLVSREMPAGVARRQNIHDVKGYNGANKAFLLVDEGNYQQAITVVNASLEQMAKGTNKWSGVPYMKLYAAGAVASAKLELIDEAREFAEKTRTTNIKQIGLEPHSLSRKRWESTAYFAMQDYEQVIATVLRKDPNAGLIKTLDAMSTFGLSLMVDPLVDKMLSSWSNFDSVPMNYMFTKSLLETGDIEKARLGFDQAIESQVLGNFAFIQPYLLQDRAKIAVMDGDEKLAVELLKQSIKVIESQRSSLTSEASRIGFAGNKQQIYAALMELLVNAGNHAEAFEYAERAKSRALVDMLAEKQTIRSKTLDLQASRQVLAELENKRVAANLVVKDRDVTRSAKPVTTENLLRDDMEFASLITVQSVEVEEITSRLSANESILEYYREGDKLFVFVVTQNSIEAVLLDNPAIEREVRSFRRSLRKSNSYDYEDKAKLLYQALIAPVVRLLQTDEVIVVPHGVLHYVPFAALHDGNAFFAQKYEVAVLPSASVLRFIDKSRPQKEGSLLVLGNPDLGNSEYDLPGAAQEALSITKHTPNARILLRAEANETSLKRYGPVFERIHFATHGEFDAEHPLSSGLLMAKDEENDGRLTVSELYEMQLETDLVTLSACETGLGKTASGDDVVGLTRGFLYAGAQSIVSSLWKVSDQATRDLMTHFYENLADHDKAKSLQLAQQQIMQEYPHPYYWAAFQLTGSN